MSVDLKAFLKIQSRSSSVVERAIADNCRFDERACDRRWSDFADLLNTVATDPLAVAWEDWGAAHKRYAHDRIEVPSGSVPEAFLDINSPAWLPRIVGGQFVVRLEALSRPLNTSGLTLAQLEGLLKLNDSGKDKDATAAVKAFFEAWNLRRDARPAFCAPRHELNDEIDRTDWPHALRDRLGLGHYGIPGAAPIDVALMAYDIGEAIAAQKAARIPAACALPTALDSGMSQFFFPVPQEHPFGATVHLAPGQGDVLTSEWLHCRIEYERKHVVKLGRITRPHTATDRALMEARDLHLLALQIECGRDDFGEPLEARA